MVGDVLTGLGGEELQEADLVAVGLVGEPVASGDGGEPEFLFGGFYRDFFGHGWLGLDAGRLSCHVAVDQDRILGASGIGIDPVLKSTRHKFSFSSGAKSHKAALGVSLISAQQRLNLNYVFTYQFQMEAL